MVGIPYAQTIFNADGSVCSKCPVCGELLVESERKDAESMSLRAYREHYEREHSTAE